MIRTPCRPRRNAAPSKARLATIVAIVARLNRDLGRDPSDYEVARLLGTSIRHVRKHRAALAQRATQR
jgi:hypothetical protein